MLAALAASGNDNLQACMREADGDCQQPINLDDIVFRHYGVRVYFDNEARKLTYALMGDCLQALAQWVWRRGRTETVFTVMELDRRSVSVVAVSNGGIGLRI